MNEHGQADTAGVPRSLIEDFSKRSAAAVRTCAERLAGQTVRIEVGRFDDSGVGPEGEGGEPDTGGEPDAGDEAGAGGAADQAGPR